MQDEADVAVGHTHQAVDVRQCADGVDICSRWFFYVRVSAGCKHERALLAGYQVFDNAQRAGMADRNRQPHERVKDNAPEGEKRQGTGMAFGPHFLRGHLSEIDGFAGGGILRLGLHLAVW